MAVVVEASDKPGEVLARADAFLASRPVAHNLVHTLLCARVDLPEPGRYWTAVESGEVVGVALHSPPDLPATLTPMPAPAVDAVVTAIAAAGETGIDPPGVTGDAATAAGFAGRWTELTGRGAEPVEGQRIYEVERIESPTGVDGDIRPARPSDRGLLVDWMRGFYVDAGGVGGDPDAVVDRHLPAGRFWIWDHRGPVSVAAHSEPVAGVARIQAVYTPGDQRGHGYASACVAALSGRVLAAGHRCILYTQLGNPTSNRIYRQIGYRSVAEWVRYEFRD
jgi:uncharacterized protein